MKIILEVNNFFTPAQCEISGREFEPGTFVFKLYENEIYKGIVCGDVALQLGFSIDEILLKDIEKGYELFLKKENQNISSGLLF